MICDRKFYGTAYPPAALFCESNNRFAFNLSFVRSSHLLFDPLGLCK